MGSHPFCSVCAIYSAVCGTRPSASFRHVKWKVKTKAKGKSRTGYRLQHTARRAAENRDCCPQWFTLRGKSSLHKNFGALASLPAGDESKHKHCWQPWHFSPIRRTPQASLSLEKGLWYLLRDYTNSVCAKATLFMLFFVNQRKWSKPDTAFRLPNETPFLLRKEQQHPQVMSTPGRNNQEGFPPTPLHLGQGKGKEGQVTN